MGWWPENHPKWGVTDPVRISSPATIRSLWRMGLLDGTPDAHILGQTETATLTPEVWTNDRGKDLLRNILRDTGIFFDVSTDILIYRGDDEAARQCHRALKVNLLLDDGGDEAVY